MGEKEGVPTIEVRQGAVDFIANTYRTNRFEFETLAKPYRIEGTAELKLPRDNQIAYRLGMLGGLVSAQETALRVLDQSDRLAAINKEIETDMLVQDAILSAGVEVSVLIQHGRVIRG